MTGSVRYPKLTDANRTLRPPPRRSGNRTPRAGLGTDGGSASTPEIFSSAAPAAWKAL